MENEHRKIAYVLYNERPMSGLVRGQVMAPLREIKRARANYDITVIGVWQPWVYFSYRTAVREMQRELASNGIALENRPLALLPSRYLMHDYRTLPILVLFVRMIFRLLGLHRFDLVHARSYLPSLATSSLRERYGYKCIFDMRSLFPEEHVTVGKWALHSKTYCKWKDYERYTVARSDAFTVVSKAMKAEADKIVPGRHADHIPFLVDIDRLRLDEGERRRVREEQGWQEKFVVVYQGSLAFEHQWNNIHNYAEYFKRMEPVVEGLHMVLVVPRVLNGSWDVLDRHGINREKITFVEGAKRLASWLSAADAGIHVMSPGPDGHTRLGVKVAEYLSCGLPVITNSNVGAAADFVEEHGVGIRLDLDDEFKDKLRDFVTSTPPREACRRLARQYFSPAVVGERYIALYEHVLGV